MFLRGLRLDLNPNFVVDFFGSDDGDLVTLGQHANGRGQEAGVGPDVVAGGAALDDGVGSGSSRLFGLPIRPFGHGF